MMTVKSISEMPTLTDADLTNTDPRLLEALARLNQIGAAINRFSVSGTFYSAHSAAEEVVATLLLIVESAIKVVPGASAVIYTYDHAIHVFDVLSRVSAGEQNASVHDAPRPDGIGTRAISQHRRVLSYEESDLTIHPVKVAAGAQAMACFPLIVANQPVGVLYVYLHEARRFRQFELLMLDNFVNQAAMAIYQARRLAHIQRDLTRKEDELNRLRRAGLLISSRLGLDETLEVILQMALEVTDAHYGIFRLVDEAGENLMARAVAGKDLGQPQLDVLPVDANSIMGWVAAHRQPLCIHDLYAAPWTRIYHPLYADMRMRSELAVPLIGSSGRLEGVLNLESPVVGAFSEQDSLLLQSLATQAVIAIQEARLLDALLEVAQLLLTEPYQEMLNHLTELACNLLDATASAVWTLDSDQCLSQVASTGYRRENGSQERKSSSPYDKLPVQESLIGEVVRTGRPVTSEDLRADMRFHRPELAREQNWARALIVPLRSTDDDRRPIGAFSVYSTAYETRHLTESEWDEKVLTCLAHYAVLALHNAQHRQALRAVQERQAIAETFAAVGDVAANVLHHLNNKVGTIPVRIQGIQDKCGTTLLADGYLAANLAEIERSAREAMAAVRENLSQLRPIHPAPVSVATCVVTAIEAAALSEAISVRTEGLDDLPVVMAGQQSLTLVFTNLLDNAAHAMRGTGLITIRGRTYGPWVEIAVSDDGPGIAPALHERIFEFNPSGRKSKRPEKAGTGKLGFGLWWVKTLMMRVGGSIAVESDGHHGTTFRLKLLYAEASS